MTDRLELNSIYIGNLSSQTDEHLLKSKFDKFGQINRVRIKGHYGFIEFENPDSIAEAIDKMHEQKIDGNQSQG